MIESMNMSLLSFEENGRDISAFCTGISRATVLKMTKKSNSLNKY